MMNNCALIGRNTSAITWTNTLKTIVILLFTACCTQINGATASESSVKPFLVMFGTVPFLTKQDVPILADYELMILDRFRFHQINKNTWKAIKTASPNTKIYLYQMGPLVANNHDNHSTYYLNNLGRFDVGRKSSDGSLNKDHPEWFLKNALGKRANLSNYPYYYYLDFGNTKFVDYWIKHSLEDISFQDWRADGIYIDESIACGRTKLSHLTANMPSKYLSCESWNKNMNGYLARASTAIHKQDQLVAANRGNSGYEMGTEAWLKLDKITSPLDVLLEEGAFAVHWGNKDVRFLPVEEWKRQIDLPASIKNSAIGMISHTDLAPNEAGHAIDGEPVSYDQILRFTVGSYLLARNLAEPTTYFLFVGNRKADGYNKLIPTKIYSKFNIGAPVTGYKEMADKNIYMRKYSDGYVYVNPTSKKIANIQLAPGFRPQVHNENIRKVGDSWHMDLNPHDAAILKSARKVTLPASPSFELK